MISFSEWVCKTRERKTYTYDVLAEYSGVSKATLYMVELGKTTPRLDTAEKICEGLGTTLENALRAIREGNARRTGKAK